VTVIDVLRRAGVEVKCLGVTGLVVRGSHGIRSRPMASSTSRLASTRSSCRRHARAKHLRDDARVQRLIQSYAGG